MAETSLERAKTGFSSAGSIGGLYFGMERNGLISALEVGGDHFEAGLEYYRRETRPATEAEENVIIPTLNYRNDAH